MFQDDKVFKMVPHNVCKKDEAGNIVAKALHELRERVSFDGDVTSVGGEYRKMVETLKNAGIEDSAIPGFANVKSRLYTLKKITCGSSAE